MMDSIFDTPAKKRKIERRPIESSGGYNSGDDSGDGLFDGFETVETVPVRTDVQRRSSDLRHSSPSTYLTQATQIVNNSPRPDFNSSDDKTSVVQVAASSPIRPPSATPTNTAQRKERWGVLASAMAPPGTMFRPPQATFNTVSPVELSDDDDGPVYRGGSSDEDSQRGRKADIRPSNFIRATQGNDRLKEITSKSFYKPFENQQKDIGSSLSGSVFDSRNRDERQTKSTFSAPGKRSIDAMANAYGSTARPKNQIRQTVPAEIRKPAVESLDQIADFQIRVKVERMQKIIPGMPLLTYIAALTKKRGNFDDAMEEITSKNDPSSMIDLTISEDEQSSHQKSGSKKQSMKRAAKQTLKAPVQSIHEKWAASKPFSKHTEPPGSPPSVMLAAKPRKRLVQGRNKAVFPAAATRKSSSPLAPSRQSTPGSDAASDSALGSDWGLSKLERRVLDFLNKCSVDDLADIAAVSETVASTMLQHRPFKDLTDAKSFPTDNKSNKKQSVRRPVGVKIVDTCIEMWTGYEAVDELVAQCERLGKPVANEIKGWGRNVFGTARNGELELVSLGQKSDVDNSLRDSGIGTPLSNAFSSDEDHERKDKDEVFFPQPSLMNDGVILKDYQIVGFNWLSMLFNRQLSCILADDMGLGKTCQVIAFLAHLLEKGNKGPHLVIVPGSTIENWLREFQVFCSTLSVIPYYAGQTERLSIQQDIESNLENINVIVTTYGVAKAKTDSKFLRSLDLQVCVYDEGHMLKNSQSAAYRQLMRIPAHFRLLLTGTPLQNNLSELVSLLAFIMPSIFKEHKQALDYVFSHKAKTTGESHAALLSAERIDRARSMMAPFILRRKKHQVLKHLPPKIRRVEYCDMNSAQLQLYECEKARAYRVLSDRAAGKKVGNDSANIMMSLRKASIHPLLFRRLYDDKILKVMARSCQREPQFHETNLDYVFEDMAVMSDYELNQFCHRYPSTMENHKLKKEEWMESGKVDKLTQLLHHFKSNGDRVLLFSQFVMVMDILEWVMETLNIRFFRLDGQTKIDERQDMIDQFHQEEDINVFLLSTKAGGAGINLACANKVIIFDSSFNPQEDIQAENRAHRVGQTREVEVIRLVSRGTIEEQIHALGQTKLALDDRVAGEDLTSKGAEDDQQAEKRGAKVVEGLMLKQMSEEKHLETKTTEVVSSG